MPPIGMRGGQLDREHNAIRARLAPKAGGASKLRRFRQRVRQRAVKVLARRRPRKPRVDMHRMDQGGGGGGRISEDNLRLARDIHRLALDDRDARVRVSLRQG